MKELVEAAIAARYKPCLRSDCDAWQWARFYGGEHFHLVAPGFDPEWLCPENARVREGATPPRQSRRPVR